MFPSLSVQTSVGLRLDGTIPGREPRRYSTSWAWLPVIALLLLASPAAAQTVTGTVTEAESLRPLASAVVSLVDESGEVRARTLTDNEGHYRLQAPTPGRYLIRAERLGWRTDGVAPIDLETGATIRRDLVARVEAVSLRGIVVETGDPVCRMDPDEGAAMVQLWEAARRILQAEALGRELGTHRYSLRNWTRELARDGRRVLDEESRLRTGYMSEPYQSAPIEELMERGWIQGERPEDGWTYYAPDAAALLSDTFMEGHCFQVVQRDDAPGLVGLAFEPARTNGPPGIRGALWLEVDTARLRLLTFQYTRPPPGVEISGPLPAHALGGQVEFAELPDGSWVVSRWHIRTPMLGVERQQVGAVVRERAVLDRINEVGGEVETVRLRGGEILALAGTGSVEGVALDSRGTHPLADGSIHLTGTSHRTRTAPDGRFHLAGVPEGTYNLVLERHGALPLLGRSDPLEVDVRAGEIAAVRVSLPSSEELVARVCEPEGGPWGPGLIAGTILGRSGEAVHVGVSVELHQVHTRVDGLWDLSALGMEWEGTATVPDEEGEFFLCAEPARGWEDAQRNWRLVVRGEAGEPIYSEWIHPSEGEVFVHNVLLR